MVEQGMSILEEAIVVATQAHTGQVDKSGQPYILHPMRVMLNVPEALRVPAILHDVLEDTEFTEQDLGFVGGLNLRTIKALTRRKDEQYFDYVNRVAQNPDAIVVKLADLKDNMMPERVVFLDRPGSMMDRYCRTYKILSKINS